MEGAPVSDSEGLRKTRFEIESEIQQQGALGMNKWTQVVVVVVLRGVEAEVVAAVAAIVIVKK